MTAIEVIDPERYRKISEPFESVDAGNEAIQGFFKELGELRIKYKIPDLYIVLKATALTSDDEEGSFTTSMHYGNTLESEGMLAWALGRVQAERVERIAKWLQGGAKTL